MPDMEGTWAGGLGSVSLTIPYGVNMPFTLEGKDYDGIRMDVIQPFYASLAKANDTLSNPFTPTGLTTSLHYQYKDKTGSIVKGPDIPFELMAREETIPESGRKINVFAIKSPLFNNINSAYLTHKGESETVWQTLLGNSAEDVSAMIEKDSSGTYYRGSFPAALASIYFNRAATNLIKQYQDKQGDANKNYKFAVINDWISGVLPAALDENGMDDMARLYYMHNTHDYRIPEQSLEDTGLNPNYFKKSELVKQVRDKQTRKKSPHVSLVETGMSGANGIFMSDSYAERVTDKSTGLGTGHLFVDRLNQHLSKHMVHDIHHVPESDFNPFKSPYLEEDGFTTMGSKGKETGNYKDVTAADIKAFKQTNKVALQKKLGLTEDPNAFLASYILSRQDSIQKGIESLIESIPQLLKKNPNLQFLISGPEIGEGDDSNKAWLESLMDPIRKEFPGRVFLEVKGHRGKDRYQYVAGTDAVIFPSSYEPYGLPQVEAPLMGCAIISSNVDGLKKTVLDPHTDTNTNDPLLKQYLEKYGQTGFKIDPFNPGKYFKAIAKRHPVKKSDKNAKPKKPMTETDKAILKEAKDNITAGLQRAVDTYTESPDDFYAIAQRAMQFSINVYSWPSMTPRYGKAILAAMADKDIAQKTYLPTQANPSGEQLSVTSKDTDATPAPNPDNNQAQKGSAEKTPEKPVLKATG